jgi:hypothetical protein
VVVGALIILFDPIFQGLAISLMAGEIASLLLSRMTVPILYYLSERRNHALAETAGDFGELRDSTAENHASPESESLALPCQPAPKESKALAMPANHRFRFEDD